MLNEIDDRTLHEGDSALLRLRRSMIDRRFVFEIGDENCICPFLSRSFSRAVSNSLRSSYTKIVKIKSRQSAILGSLICKKLNQK